MLKRMIVNLLKKYFLLLCLISGIISLNIKKAEKNNVVTNAIKTETDTLNLSQMKIKSQLKMQMQMKLQTFGKYYDEYSKIKINQDYLNEVKKKSKGASETNNVLSDTLYAYYNKQTMEMEFTGTAKPSSAQNSNNDILAAMGTYDRTRYQTGWDKLNIKTYAAANPLIQCWTSGFIEGVLSSDEISYYYDNIHVFFYQQEKYISDIKNFYGKIDKNLREKISPESFDNMKKNGASFKEFQHWSYITCLHAQLDGLHTGYNTIADKKLDLLDFYFINSEGNFGDLKTFMKINKIHIDDVNQFYTNENLRKVYNSDNIEKIWKNLLKKGHCSAIVKLVTDPITKKMDMLSGHNTWSEYCEMLRTLKHVEYEFEGTHQNYENTIGMNPRKINYSSYPGVLFSGDDFYQMDSKIVILQTTLSAMNRFVYKDILNIDSYIPEFMRIMITNHISTTGKEWVENYSSYKNHMYITQWVVLDYNVLSIINNDPKYDIKNYKDSGLINLLEEVPGSIISKDISEIVLAQTYFGSFNLPYFNPHQKILGLTQFAGIDFTSKEYNPRYNILQNLHSGVKDIYDFSHLIQYNGFKKFNPRMPKDPSYAEAGNGISSRDDLDGDANNRSYHGGIDFKVVNSDLVDKNTIYAYGGPTKDSNVNLTPFNFEKIPSDDFHVSYHKGIPKLWNFSPLFFSG